MQNDPFQAPSYFWSSIPTTKAQLFNRKPPQSCDVAIVGAGATGLSAALSAAQQGLKVVVLEAANEIGGISKDNGGIVLDGIEGDIAHIKLKYGKDGKDIARRLLEISRRGLGSVAQIAQDVCETRNFRRSGVITAFSTPRQRDAFKSKIQMLCRLLPDLYRHDHFEWIQADAIHSPYYKMGGVFSRHGGTINSARLIWDLANTIANFPGTVISVQKTVEGIEAASAHGVRLFYTDKLGNKHELLAKRCILTGNAWELIEPGFTKKHHMATGMLATSALPFGFIEHLPDELIDGVPMQGSQTISPDYFRFVRDGKDMRLLFGSGGRAGMNEEQETIRDVKDRLFTVFPDLKKSVRRGEVRFTHEWARRQVFSSNDLPVVKGYDPTRKEIVALPATSKGATKATLPHIPVLYVGELGGHGITFSYDLGRRAGRMGVSDYRTLQFLSEIKPVKASATSRQLKVRAAADRLEHERQTRRAGHKKRKPNPSRHVALQV